MKKNMGIIDIAVRLVIAVLLIVLYFTHVVTGTTGIVLLVVAGVLILTSVFGICPMYMPFNLSTRSKE